MKRILVIFAMVVCALRLPAQTNPPARLALVAESPEAASVADVLTAEFSSHTNLQLLERQEIEKVYREQSLAAGNRDYLKLGQLLGADGLLLLETVKDGTNQSLNIRLVAVKPGVVLIAGKLPWPMKSVPEWSPIFARHLDVFLPKLTVLVQDAIPISVVNLRSAVASGEAQETERQLKLLTIQRLSQERQLFVLERQKMQLLSEEKALKVDDSAFWNGRYLLEGVVDQNGYTKDTVTINARLTPPKGGVPLPPGGDPGRKAAPAKSKHRSKDLCA
jgi:TolB-like protein